MELPDSVKRKVMRIEVFSHGFKVTDFTDRGKAALLDFARGMAQYGLVKVGRNQFERKMLRVFAAATKSRAEFRFHRNQFEDFLFHLARFGWTRTDLDIVERPIYIAPKIDHKLKDKRVPRDYQIMLSDYVKAECPPQYAPSKVLTLQTGRGKSFIDLLSVDKMSERVVLVIKGMFVDKWIEDIEGAYDYKKGDLLVIRGAKDLAALIQLALHDELKAKFIIITSKTWFNYMKVYEQFDGVIDELFGVNPDGFYELLQCGSRHIDEVHMDFHCNFRQDLYSHVPKTVSLSATLESDDPVVNRFYEIVWPLSVRPPEIEYDKFIVMEALWYDADEPHRLRHMGATKQYSHGEFEKSVMRNKHILAKYLDMLSALVRHEYVNRREEGQSMLLFCGLTDMCTLVRDRLRRDYPNLNISRYTEEEDYDEHFLKPDIVISTIQSAGTAVDKPNLLWTLMTVALSSKQSNIQVLGRTRRLVGWPDVRPKFSFLSCRQIDKHVKYTKEKFEKLDGKVLSAKELILPFRI